MEPFIGQIIMFGGNFAIRGYAICSGQLMSIAQNTALFSILGTTYGGNGQTTFGLPDLRGRVPIGQGQGPGLPNFTLGQLAGTTSVTLNSSNMPIHNHSLVAVTETGNVASPQNAFLAATGALDPEYRASGSNVAMAPQSIGNAGSSQPFSIMPPYLTINYLIALEGIYPSRN
ncbi:phage tail protein [Spirosoma utsteinense]|uniref:Microcystin-dependent protein n=1 Tax=Spirosoma utsteinense TaxID=2585773 RepID=A0ABR6WCM3_9BACT|nr:tail fiber protein [Spirosoma utsteinense]MBC3788354.1 microcystin-dependent protein [Spirosoma utsteinense]MBC3794271.1 microcystin-dependent protein [Spirosoma utsteinense]